MSESKCFLYIRRGDSYPVHILDHAFTDQDGECRSLIHKNTLSDFQKEYPGTIIIDTEIAYQLYRGQCLHPPKKITEEEWWTAFECLPPVNSVFKNGWSTFKLSEKHAADVTNIYAKFKAQGKEEFFVLCDSINTPHDEIVRRVQEAFPSLVHNANS